MTPSGGRTVKGLVIVAWLTFVVNQEISRRRAMTNVVVEGRASMLAHAVPIAFGASVLILSSLLTARVLAGGGMWPWVGTALVLLGLAFSTWARIELGASSRVGLKQDHVLISSGPYQFAQHPMYVGAAVAAAGTAFVVGNVVAFLGAAIVCLGLVIKARIERNWLPPIRAAAATRRSYRCPTCSERRESSNIAYRPRRSAGESRSALQRQPYNPEPRVVSQCRLYAATRVVHVFFSPAPPPSRGR